MSAERITVEAVEASVVEFDAQERPVVAGQVVMDFTQVGVLTSLLAPREWEEVAAYLDALIGRAPLASGKAYLAHRTVLGALAGELHGYARAAGEPVGLEVDLRAATSKAEERRIRERIADQEAAFSRHVDDVIHQTAAQREFASRQEPPHEQEEPPTEPEKPAAPTTEQADDQYLL